VLVCDNVIGRAADPDSLLDGLKAWLRHAPVCVLSVGEGEAAGGAVPGGWTVEKLENLLRAKGLNLKFIGLAANSESDPEKRTITAIIEKSAPADGETPAPSAAAPVPADFRVVALMMLYNEEDVIVPTIEYLASQDIDVYVIDNWSTDGTPDLVRQYMGRGVIGMEKYPKDAPPEFYDLRGILTRKEQLARELRGDWFIHYDADEIRVSPWPGVSLKQGIYYADRAGFNAIDHTMLLFPPVDNGYVDGTNYEDYFKHFEFGRDTFDFLRIGAWKYFGQDFSLAESGGHEVTFQSRRVFPYKFLTKHYPMRSQMHGERKVFRERRPRYKPAAKASGWHHHYDRLADSHNFLRDPAELGLFDEAAFNRTFLVERLTGIGAAI
jgi:glycosyltransferase involved in cell wall biosynthesis